MQSKLKNRPSAARYKDLQHGRQAAQLWGKSGVYDMGSQLVPYVNARDHALEYPRDVLDECI